ncbi:MAG TPA: phosphatidylserine decarboxylase [Gammaproteobacteria bacterium]|nr:phosphatidylserine decarboxylase [Gammaproteobacteria bacterium]
MKLPIHREGWPIIAVFLLATAGLWVLWPPLVVPGGLLSLWCIWFFRDPEREAPDDETAILAPADGRLLPIVDAPPPAELEMGPTPLTRLSIFMNIFNVHVNRLPATGKIIAMHYRPGRFFNASFDKASEHNERLSALMELGGGERLAFVQIAGLVARRIRSTLNPGDTARRGARFGIIRFGSRVDVYLPPGAQVAAVAGQRMTAGETVIARLDGRNAPLDDALGAGSEEGKAE